MLGRSLQRLGPNAIANFRCNSKRGFGGLWRPARWDRDAPPGSLANYVDRRFRDMDSEFMRVWGFTPFRIFRDKNVERFHMEQPIVEEDGVKKFKLVFDVQQFKPEEIIVKIKDNRLSVEAKQKSKDENCESYFEFRREYNFPEGVKQEEVTCKYKDDGSLVFEAPYTPPNEPVKEQDVKIQRD